MARFDRDVGWGGRVEVTKIGCQIQMISMIFEGPTVKEQGVTFAVVVVKGHVLNSSVGCKRQDRFVPHGVRPNASCLDSGDLQGQETARQATNLHYFPFTGDPSGLTATSWFFPPLLYAAS